MTRYVWIVAAGALAISLPLCSRQQNAPQEPLVFDVVSVKPSAPDEPRGMVHQMPGGQQYEVIGAPLRVIMTVAYTVTDRQLAGGPDWINTDRWNIEAKANRRGTSDELHDALARLLEDRFHLKIRHESRELPVYLLTVDKKGSKMPLHDSADLLHEPIGGNPLRGLTGNNVTMNYFAFFLSRLLDLNVLDRTSLTDHYDVKLQFVPDGPPGGGRGGGDVAAPPVPVDGPDIYTALRDQLGLQLQKGRGPVDFLVVEHAEKPTDN